MQEITIKPRAAFKHYVTVDAPNKELSWTFGTKSKGLAFGLFRKVTLPNPPTLTTSTLRPSSAPLNKSPTSRVLPSSNEEQRNSHSSASHPTPAEKALLKQLSVMHAPLESRKSFTDIDTFLNKRKSTSSISVEAELMEIIPIEHYECAKMNIKGSYIVNEPGTYVLFFDNTFSMNTSKKLHFFVSVRDKDALEPCGSVMTNVVEGWILKKGDRKLQGYSKRWMKIDTNGTLTYSKTKDGYLT